MFFIFNIVHFVMTGAILTYNKNMRTPDTDSICVKHAEMEISVKIGFSHARMGDY